MGTYRVKWEIDIDADSLQDAANEARDAQQDPDNEATVFNVADLSRPILKWKMIDVWDHAFGKEDK